MVHVRLAHHVEELPRIGRQAFDIAPLPFGEDDVEGERRFARAVGPEQRDDLAPGDGEVDVGEAYIGRVQAKMPVEATLNSYPDWKIPAEVISIIPTADRGKATVKVRVALKAKDPRIVPDMGVTVSFLEKAAEGSVEQPRGVRVPSTAITQREGADVVFVVGAENVVELRQVKLGGVLGDDRAVEALERATKDTDADVRGYARRALHAAARVAAS